MIVVTGATGKLGGEIVQQLRRRSPTSPIGVSVHRPDAVRDLADIGVRVRYGDFADPPSLSKAFEGASQLLLVSTNALAYGGDTLGQHKAAIDEARIAGVRRVVYTSHMAASLSSVHIGARDHAATEAILAQSGLAWTALRNGFYATRALDEMGNASVTGVVEAARDGKVSWTSHRGLAEAASIILLDETLYPGPTPPLTALEALDLADVAAIASELLGRTIERRVIPDSEIQARMLARGVQPKLARLAQGLYLASRAGEFSAVDPTLSELLKRRPTSLRELLVDKLTQATKANTCHNQS